MLVFGGVKLVLEQFWHLGLIVLNSAVRVQLEKATDMNEFCEL